MLLLTLLFLTQVSSAQTTSQINITPFSATYVTKSEAQNTFTVKNRQTFSNFAGQTETNWNPQNDYQVTVTGTMPQGNHANGKVAVLNGTWTGNAYAMVRMADKPASGNSAFVLARATMNLSPLTSVSGGGDISWPANRETSINAGPLVASTGPISRPIKLISKWVFSSSNQMTADFTFQPGSANAAGRAMKNAPTKMEFDSEVIRTVTWTFAQPQSAPSGRPISFTPDVPTGTTIDTSMEPGIVQVIDPSTGHSEGEYITATPHPGAYFYIFNPFFPSPVTTAIFYLPGYLIQKIPSIEVLDEAVTISSPLSPVSITIVPGDVDADNEIGPGDFELVTTTFGKSNTDPDWSTDLPNTSVSPQDCDINQDGEVGPSDYEVLVFNFGKQGEDWVTTKLVR